MRVVRTPFIFRVWNRKSNVSSIIPRTPKIIGSGQTACAQFEAFLNKLWFCFSFTILLVPKVCFFLPHGSVRGNENGFAENSKGRQHLLTQDGSWGGTRTHLTFFYFVEWNWCSSLKRMLLFENGLGFALKPRFPWAAVCFWQPPASQELPDGLARFSFDFVAVTDTATHLSLLSLPEGLTLIIVCWLSQLMLASSLLPFPKKVPAQPSWHLFGRPRLTRKEAHDSYYFVDCHLQRKHIPKSMHTTHFHKGQFQQFWNSITKSLGRGMFERWWGLAHY